MGAISKPVAGCRQTVLLVYHTAKGARNTVTLLDGRHQVARRRLPRHIPPDGRLKPYSQEDAFAQALIYAEAEAALGKQGELLLCWQLVAHSWMMKQVMKYLCTSTSCSAKR